MGIEAPAEVKYGLIQAAAQNDGNLLNISWMCRIAGVSRSGFYAWRENAPVRQRRERDDEAEFELVLEAYRFRNRPKGARGIHMRLLHMDIRMNVKKIRRLMKKYGLKCPIRRGNPYRKMAKDMRTSHVAPNIVNRDFFQAKPRRILLTDITYLFYKTGRCYLSTILDAVTREILAYRVSESFEVGFVLETVDALILKYGCTLDNTTIVHSDQGCHYTSNAFIEKLRDNGFVQSMSRKGNCWDNAPQESFFGHMKDEIADAVASAVSFEEVKRIVDDQIDYYNNDRYQWQLLKLSPAEYYNYLTTGVYPLPLYSPET